MAAIHGAASRRALPCGLGCGCALVRRLRHRPPARRHHRGTCGGRTGRSPSSDSPLPRDSGRRWWRWRWWRSSDGRSTWPRGSSRGVAWPGWQALGRGFPVASRFGRRAFRCPAHVLALGQSAAVGLCLRRRGPATRCGCPTLTLSWRLGCVLRGRSHGGVLAPVGRRRSSRRAWSRSGDTTLCRAVGARATGGSELDTGARPMRVVNVATPRRHSSRSRRWPLRSGKGQCAQGQSWVHDGTRVQIVGDAGHQLQRRRVSATLVSTPTPAAAHATRTVAYLMSHSQQLLRIQAGEPSQIHDQRRADSATQHAHSTVRRKPPQTNIMTECPPPANSRGTSKDVIAIEDTLGYRKHSRKVHAIRKDRVPALQQLLQWWPARHEAQDTGKSDQDMIWNTLGGGKSRHGVC